MSKMHQILRKALMLNSLRSSLYVNKKIDDSGFGTFVNEMNVVSRDLGMASTHWVNPSGLAKNGEYSQTTARDLAIMGLYASQNKVISEIWSKHEYNYEVHRPFIWPFNKKIKRNLKSTIQHIECEDDIEILGGKTGSGDGYNTLLMVAKICGKICSAVVMGVSTENARFSAMAELLNRAKCLLCTGGGVFVPVVHANNACVYVQDNSHPICLFEQNADFPTAPMSITKIMTIIVALKYIDNVYAKIKIFPNDLDECSSSGYHPKEWENLYIKDLFHELLLPSSNIAANALARCTGYLIKNNYDK